VMRTARQQGKGVMDELRTRLKQAWTAETGMG
jgi:hypothetical protein